MDLNSRPTKLLSETLLQKQRKGLPIIFLNLVLLAFLKICFLLVELLIHRVSFTDFY